jgi:adenylyltransferase/sulfurtransferase
VLVVGAGGLGSPVIQYLAAAGVGGIGVVDGDVVDESNLQRQVLHSSSLIGQPKTSSARIAVERLNPHVVVEQHELFLNAEHARKIISDYDIVVDGTDNFEARYLVHDVSYWTEKPYVYGSIFQFHGQASTFIPGSSPCYRCLFPTPPSKGTVPSCSEAGVLGVLPGIIGVLQATECIKVVTGIGKPLTGRLLRYDALEMSFRESMMLKDPECPLCSERPTVTSETDHLNAEHVCCDTGCDSLMPDEEMSIDDLLNAMQRGETPVLVDIREPRECAEGVIPGSEQLPLSQSEHLKNSLLSRSGEVVLICRTGVRTASAVKFFRPLLESREDLRVKSLKGGILEFYQKTGIPGVEDL